MSINPPIRCFIIDDEPLAQELLIDHVDRTPSLQLVGTATNGQQALALCAQQKPDLLFLDIRMPRLSGFDFLDLLPKPVPLVVVTTAYREYALKGYEHAIVDFLEKPIFHDRFSQAIRRVEERFYLTHRSEAPRIANTDESLRIESQMLSVRADRTQVNIPLETVSYVESLENYVKIYLLTQKDKPIVSKLTIAQIERELPSQHFVRVHRTYLVRIDQINVVTQTSIKLFTGEEVPIGVTYRDSVRQTLYRSGITKAS